MRKIFLLITFFTLSIFSFSQDIVGQWDFNYILADSVKTGENLKPISEGDFMQINEDGSFNYTLAAISGILVLDIDDCFNRIKLITKEISNIFPNTKPTNEKNLQVTFGKHTYNKFELNDGDNVKVSCVDYDSTNEYPDHLRIAINNGDYQDWLNEKAYK